MCRNLPHRIRTTHFIIDVVSANTVRIHEKWATLTSARTAFWNVRIVLRSPIMTEFVSGHQISFSRDNSLPVMITTRTQSRIKVQRVSILKVF